MIEYEFKGHFLNRDGLNAEKSGVETDGVSKYYELRPVTLNVDCIESYFELLDKFNNKPLCKITMQSGDIWCVAISYERLRDIKKGMFAIKAN